MTRTAPRTEICCLVASPTYVAFIVVFAQTARVIGLNSPALEANTFRQIAQQNRPHLGYRFSTWA